MHFKIKIFKFRYFFPRINNNLLILLIYIFIIKCYLLIIFNSGAILNWHIESNYMFGWNFNFVSRVNYCINLSCNCLTLNIQARQLFILAIKRRTDWVIIIYISFYWFLLIYLRYMICLIISVDYYLLILLNYTFIYHIMNLLVFLFIDIIIQIFIINLLCYNSAAQFLSSFIRLEI